MKRSPGINLNRHGDQVVEGMTQDCAHGDVEMPRLLTLRGWHG